MKTAVKQLTASDLSLFEPHYDPQRSRQKAINLNANVFVEELYPGLRDRRSQVTFSVEFLGPGRRPPHTLTRKVIRSPGAKNWRLDGELVRNPHEDPTRFDGLAPGDLAVLGFVGDQLPAGLVAVLVSAGQDPDLHAALSSLADFTGRNTMRVLTPAQIRQAIDASSSQYSDGHPLLACLPGESVEDALFGDQSAEAVHSSDGRGLTLDAEGLLRQLESARETGERGEALFAAWLASSGLSDEQFEWVSSTHARAAFDFIVEGAPWSSDAGIQYVDVKSSKDSESTKFHVSLAEIRWAAEHPYIIARVTGVEEDRVRLRVLDGLGDLSRGVLSTLAELPAGVRADSFRVEDDLLSEIAEYELAASILDSEE